MLNLATILLAIGAMLYRALVVEILWGWFVVRQFHVEPLTFWSAFGLLLLLGVLKGNDGKTPDTKRLFMAALFAVLGWSLTLLIGYVVLTRGIHGA